MSVVELASYRKVKQEKEKALQYFCTKCDGNVFLLQEIGRIHCASCGAKMRNLMVFTVSEAE